MLLTMYDAVNTAEIPEHAQAVAGYVNGRWPTFNSLAVSHPHAYRLSIAVTAEADADCLDIEHRDATNAQAPAWVRRQQARGVIRPVVYTFLANADALVRTLDAAGIKRSQYRLWIAHWTFRPHFCGPKCGYGLRTTADATQWTDKALGKNLDASLVTDEFFDQTSSRRRALRTWILARRDQGWSWAALKQTANWKLWRRLGGR